MQGRRCIPQSMACNIQQSSRSIAGSPYSAFKVAGLDALSTKISRIQSNRVSPSGHCATGRAYLAINADIAFRRIARLVGLDIPHSTSPGTSSRRRCILHSKILCILLSALSLKQCRLRLGLSSQDVKRSVYCGISTRPRSPSPEAGQQSRPAQAPEGSADCFGAASAHWSPSGLLE